MKSTAGSGVSNGPGTVVATIAGRRSLHLTSTIVRAMPPARSSIAPVANVIGEVENANSPTTTSQAGMVAVRLNSIGMVVVPSGCVDVGPTKNEAE